MRKGGSEGECGQGGRGGGKEPRTKSAVAAAAKISNLVCSKGREKVSLASPQLLRPAQ